MTKLAGWKDAFPLSTDTAATHAYRAGFRLESAAIMIAIAIAESQLVPNARNVNKDGSLDRGILQINTIHKDISDAQADDPAQAFTWAYGYSKGGTQFGIWVTYSISNPPYRKYLERARAAVARVESLAAAGRLPADVDPKTPGDQPATAGDVISAPIAGTLVEADSVPLSARLLRVRGQDFERWNCSPWIIAATLDLSVDEASQLSLSFADPITAPSLFMPVGTGIDLADLRFRVTSRAQGPGGALAQQNIVALASGIEKLRMADTLGDAKTWQQTSYSQVLADEAKAAGLGFVGEAGPVYPQLSRLGKGETSANHAGDASDPTLKKRAESTWEFADRAARREGKWRFEAGGVLYFGRPSWLVSKLTRFTVKWRHNVSAGYLVPLLEPEVEGGVDEDHPNRIAGPRTIRVQLPRGLADRIRPGMVMLYDGTPGWATRPFDGAGPDGYLVTHVTVDLLDYTAPLVVEAREAVDPTPVPEDGDPAFTPSTSSTTKTPPISTSKATALDMVTAALGQVGTAYVYGAEADPKNPDPDAFDCSELVQWACAQAGLTWVDGSAAQLAAVKKAGLTMTVAEASLVRGALLFRAGHVAISLGDGKRTVEARGRKYGTVEGPIGDGRFTDAGLVPGLYYGTGKVKAAA